MIEIGTEQPHVNPWPLYRRLLRYAFRYRMHLLVGMLGGMLCGGSLFGLLQLSPRMLEIVELNTAAPPAAEKPAPGAVAPAAPSKESMFPSWLKEAEKQAARFNIPLMQSDGRPTWQFVLLGLLIVPIIVGARLVALYFNQYCLRWLGARVVRDLRDELFETIENQSLKFHGSIDVGHLISRNVTDTSMIEMVINTALAEASRAPFEILGSVIFVILFARERHMFSLLLLLLIAFPVCILPLLIMGRRVRNWTRQSLDRISDIISVMHENLTCIRVVKAFHMEKAEALRYREMNRRYFKTIMRAVRVELALQPMMEALGILMGASFLVICFARGLKFSEIIPIGAAGILAYRPIRSLAKIVPVFERGVAAQARIFEALDLDMRLPEAPHACAKPTFDDRIRFEDVTFRYQPRGEPVIRHAAFDVPHGSMVAVVGATGSGKTTLANLLARFYDPTDGRVSMDGIDLRQIRIADVRKLIGVLSQETVLFNETIAFNIAYGTEGATRAQIQAAAEQANAHAFIAAHHDGYDRVVGEKGFVLSGGERQRIAIARIMLRNPPILILDEATSALDTVTERQVQEEIARAMANRTTFAIAHRLSTIRRADLILVVDKGEIVERGTHESLYAYNGMYRRLCDMQFADGEGVQGLGARVQGG